MDDHNETDVREEEHVEIEAGSLSEDDLAAVRELALRAYPETVPEMVSGESIAALMQSLEPAAAAYQRIAAGVAARAPATVAAVAPVVPAGSAPAVTVDLERLPSVEKIRRGLATRR